ncbi:MAG: hypothetical protein WC055_00160 [Melioribacteraceae bacterium]
MKVKTKIVEGQEGYTVQLFVDGKYRPQDDFNTLDYGVALGMAENIRERTKRIASQHRRKR